ncbi:MAG: ABC transporter substrate-binding protein, partial [Anaerolinea sp.]|nr:ABC transporter substrate-binding protein [Anaerolinea sp.]
MHKLRLLIVVLALIAVGVSAQEAALPRTETLFLTFVPNVQFAPIYTALEQGYFRTAGFDVQIEYGDEPVGVDLIAAGQRNFGTISGEQVLAARARDRDVVMVYQWFHDYPVGIVYSPASGIRTVRDLAGRVVGIPGRFGATYSGLIALLTANGMTEADIRLEEIGFNAPEVFCTGRVEASVVYLNNEPLQIANRVAAGDCGAVQSIAVFPVAEQVSLVSNGLVTSQRLLDTDPESVAAFVSAFDAGLRDVIHNPALGYLNSGPYVETLPLSDDLRAALEDAAVDAAEFQAANPNATREDHQERRAALRARLGEQFSDAELLQFDVL